MSTNTALKFAPRKQADFYATVTARVNEYFTKHQKDKTGDFRLYLKSIILISLYLLPFVAIITLPLSTFWTMAAYMVMGIGMAGIGFNIMHDANHGSYSQRPWVNRIMGYTLQMVGGNAALWKIQHNVLHHTYTNIHGMDEDIADKPILRLAPEGKWRPIHRFQSYYAWFLYGLATLSWVVSKDASDLVYYKKQGLLQRTGAKAGVVLADLIVSKVVYVFMFFGLTFWLGALPWYWYVAGFLWMHVIGGLVTTVVFQLAHVVEHTDFFQPDDENRLPNAWAEHQLRTTCNFARNNKLLSWYVGGLNFQIEHHLFSNISHVHYKDIAPIVKKTAAEFNLPYHEFRTLWQAIDSHAKMLGRLGRKEVASAVA